MTASSFRVFQGKFACTGLRHLLVGFPLRSRLVVQGIVGVGLCQQTLDGQQDGFHLQGGRPVLFQNVETNPAQVICIRANLPMLGWYIFVSNTTLGGDIG
jgi:hypothetical protein